MTARRLDRRWRNQDHSVHNSGYTAWLFLLHFGIADCLNETRMAETIYGMGGRVTERGAGTCADGRRPCLASARSFCALAPARAMFLAWLRACSISPIRHRASSAVAQGRHQN